MNPINIEYPGRKSTVCYTTSTFLVPDRYLNFFLNRCKALGSRRAYLTFMVENMLPKVNLFQVELEKRRNPKWKTDYQRRGLELCRKNFVPLPDDWEEFRNFASAFGVSMCFLFVFLMETEELGQKVKELKLLSPKMISLNALFGMVTLNSGYFFECQCKILAKDDFYET